MATDLFFNLSIKALDGLSKKITGHAVNKDNDPKD